MVKISELRMREVVNVNDGRRLGPIKDIDINLEEGKIGAIILPGQGGKVMGFFGRDEEIVVPWEKIVRIGVDVILVDLRHPQDQRYEGQGGYHNDEKFW